MILADVHTLGIYLKIFFWCGPFLKSLLNLLQYCFCFMLWFFGHWGMWDLSSPTRDWTHTPCIGRQTLNHWTAREVRSLGSWGQVTLDYLGRALNLMTSALHKKRRTDIEMKAMRRWRQGSEWSVSSQKKKRDAWKSIPQMLLVAVLRCWGFRDFCFLH